MGYGDLWWLGWSCAGARRLYIPGGRECMGKSCLGGPRFGPREWERWSRLLPGRVLVCACQLARPLRGRCSGGRPRRRSREAGGSRSRGSGKGS